MHRFSILALDSGVVLKPSPGFGRSPALCPRQKPDKIINNLQKKMHRFGVRALDSGVVLSLLLALAKAPLSVLGRSRIKSNNSKKDTFGDLAIKNGVLSKQIF